MQVLHSKHVGDVEILKRYHTLTFMRRINGEINLFSKSLNLAKLKENANVYEFEKSVGQIERLPENYNEFSVVKEDKNDCIRFSIYDLISAIPEEYLKKGSIVEIKSVERTNVSENKCIGKLQIAIYTD